MTKDFIKKRIKSALSNSLFLCVFLFTVFSFAFGSGGGTEEAEGLFIQYLIKDTPFCG
ncbi:hypothetical protein STRDD11_00789 [Streptococcus sp. DD11]|nr:hypothetical protein STRDD11_00789 [Streptococcus sp. DD11]